jgi:serine/threonine protein kinase
VVKLGTHKRTGQRVAVKCIDRSGLPEDGEASLRQEVDILKALDHPNIVKLIDFFEEDKFFYVVMEYLEGGELFDRIVKKNCYNEKEARDLVFSMLSAMKYCHDRQIAHRDMKPENLLLASLDDDANVKIADFGFAIKGKPNANTLSTQCGTPGYVAPEILFSKQYDKSVDMWSIGVITYVLLGGYPPFHDDNQKQLFRKIKKGDYEFHAEYWGNVSDEAKELISKLLTVDPAHRYTVDQALAHPWINRDAKTLAARNLDGNLGELRKYQATKKFRAAARAVSNYISIMFILSLIVRLYTHNLSSINQSINQSDYCNAKNEECIWRQWVTRRR